MTEDTSVAEWAEFKLRQRLAAHVQEQRETDAARAQYRHALETCKEQFARAESAERARASLMTSFDQCAASHVQLRTALERKVRRLQRELRAAKGAPKRLRAGPNGLVR